MRPLRLSGGRGSPRFNPTFVITLAGIRAGADMSLSSDAPIVAVPMCVKHIDGQSFHTVGEKYLTAVIEGAGAYPLSFPALGPVLAPAALLDQVDGILFTGSPSNVAVHHYEGAPDRADSPQDPGRDA